MYINYRKKVGEVMYYVVDQSNPKEPMEYIRVTKKDVDEIDAPYLFMDDNDFKKLSSYVNPKFHNDHSLWHFTISPFHSSFFYDTKPEKVGTLYTYLLNICDIYDYNHHSINLYNDIDFILFFL